MFCPLKMYVMIFHETENNTSYFDFPLFRMLSKLLFVKSVTPLTDPVADKGDRRDRSKTIRYTGNYFIYSCVS